jgi:hypothetical protein
VALPAELALEYDLFHVDIVGAGLHFEDGGMADLALNSARWIQWGKMTAACPLLGLAIEHHVSVKALNRFTGQPHAARPITRPAAITHPFSASSAAALHVDTVPFFRKAAVRRKKR